MSEQKPPVPLPRTQYSVLVEPPQSPTEYSERNRHPSIPPPLPPKRWIKTPVRNDTLLKVVDELSSKGNTKAPVSPPPVPPHKQDAKTLSYSYDETMTWSELCTELKLRGASEEEAINVKAEKIYTAIQSYIQYMSDHGDTMKEHINELQLVADNLDKVSKGTKIAGITGGASTVAGGVAAAAGVILSPFTMGASLALTAVGVGVAAVGGVTGASAAIANKVSSAQDKKKIEKLLHEYEQLNENSVASLKSVDEGMEHLKQYGVSALGNVKMYSEKATKVLTLVATKGAGTMALEASSTASGMIKGFSMGMDFYYTEGKNGPTVKKGLESKFGKKIRKLAANLHSGLEELINIKHLFTEHS